jgi:hypothetical protein
MRPSQSLTHASEFAIISLPSSSSGVYINYYFNLDQFQAGPRRR